MRMLKSASSMNTTQEHVIVSVSAGYQIEVPKSNITFRGMVDTNWAVAAVMEKRLPSLSFAFVLS